MGAEQHLIHRVRPHRGRDADDRRRYAPGIRALRALAVTVAVAVAIPARAHAAAPMREKQAIRHVVTVLFGALEHRDFHLACQQYSESARALLVLVAHLRRHAIHDCAHACAFFVKTAHPDLRELRYVHVKRIAISGNSAAVRLSATAPGHRTSTGTLTMRRGDHGWKVAVTLSSKLP